MGFDTRDIDFITRFFDADWMHADLLSDDDWQTFARHLTSNEEIYYTNGFGGVNFEYADALLELDDPEGKKITHAKYNIMVILAPCESYSHPLLVSRAQQRGATSVEEIAASANVELVTKWEPALVPFFEERIVKREFDADDLKVIGTQEATLCLEVVVRQMTRHCVQRALDALDGRSFEQFVADRNGECASDEER